MHDMKFEDNLYMQCKAQKYEIYMYVTYVINMYMLLCYINDI